MNELSNTDQLLSFMVLTAEPYNSKYIILHKFEEMYQLFSSFLEGKSLVKKNV